MSWRIFRWWLAGLIAYLIFLLATFPASYAITWLQKRLPDVQLVNVSGSVWSGAAGEFSLHGQSWGALRWHFDWRAPFSGHLGYRLQLLAPDTEMQVRVQGGGDKLLLQHISGHLPITQIEPWLPVPAGSISGMLELELNKVLLVDQRPVLAEGTVNFTGIRLSWPQSITLGNYRLQLSAQDQNGIQGSYTDTSGPLVLQGTLEMTTSGHYQVSGTLTNRDQNNAALNTLLGYLPLNGNGQHPFNFNGEW